MHLYKLKYTHKLHAIEILHIYNLYIYYNSMQYIHYTKTITQNA